MEAVGNTRQDINKGGWVKAIFYYHSRGNECFQGVVWNNAPAANTCNGFSRVVGEAGPGESIITFPFPICSRYIVITPQWGGNSPITVNYEIISPNQVRVQTWRAGGVFNGDLVDSAFTLVVF